MMPYNSHDVRAFIAEETGAETDHEQAAFEDAYAERYWAAMREAKRLAKLSGMPRRPVASLGNGCGRLEAISNGEDE